MKNTEKITYAMKLVSAAKLRRAQDALLKAREYVVAMQTLLDDILLNNSQALPNYPIMTERAELKKVRLVVIGGKRGLSGAYNSNVNRCLEEVRAQYKDKCELEIMPVGKQPAEYCKRKGYNYLNDYEDLAEDVEDWPVDEIYASLEKAFLDAQVDEVLLLYTCFHSAMSVKPEVRRLLPFCVEKKSETSGSYTLFEPSLEQVLQVFIPKYARAKMLVACLEAKTSEHGSRMTAMDAATHNAGDLISSLTLTHNKLRQANITNDLLDIIGGAA